MYIRPDSQSNRPQTRSLFPRSYAETNFSSGVFGAAKRRAAIDSSSFTALLCHVRDDNASIAFSEQSRCPSYSEICVHKGESCVSYGSVKPFRKLYRMAVVDLVRLIPRFLDQRIWEYYL